MTTEYFKKLFEYDSHVNYELFDSIQEAGLEKPKKIFAHLLAAKMIWLHRIRGIGFGIEIWPNLDLTELEQLIIVNKKEYQDYLSKITDEDLLQNISYKNSKGQTFESSILNIFSHVIIHSGYHRGQIAKYMREAGREPLNTDYITYLRSIKK